MKEDDRQLLERVKEIEDFKYLLERLDEEGIEYNELDLAKQYEMIHSPFAMVEAEY